MLFDIEALEKWETIAQYRVEADSYAEAREKVKRGDCAYDSHKHPGNDDEFIVVLDVEIVEVEAPPLYCSACDEKAVVGEHFHRCIICGVMLCNNCFISSARCRGCEAQREEGENR